MTPAPAPSITVRFRLRELLEARATAGSPMSQSELARRSGVPLSTVNEIHAGKQKQISLISIARLCEALSVDPGDLFLVERPKLRKRG